MKKNKANQKKREILKKIKVKTQCKKETDENAVVIKLKRIKIPIEMKKEIIEKREKGVTVKVLAREYNRTTSTICSILKDKETLKANSAAKGVSRRSDKRSKVMDDVERSLLVWINKKQAQGEHIPQHRIREKAKQLFDDIVQALPTTSTSTAEEFKASEGWFKGFKKRTGIINGRRDSVGSVDQEATNDIVESFEDEAEKPEQASQQISNENDSADELVQGSSLEVLAGSQDVIVEEIANPQLPADVKEFLKAWDFVSSYIENHHPYKPVAVQINEIYEKIAITPFRNGCTA